MADRLIDMNSISKVIEASTAVLGPMLSGFVYAFIDIRIFIAANAVSFLFSAVMEYCVNFKLGTNVDNTKDHQRIHIIKDIRCGMVYMKDKKEIAGAFLFLTVLNFFIGFSVLVPLPYILNNILLLGSVNYGMIQAAFPVGAILGALLIRCRSKDAGYTGILLKASGALACSIVFIILPILFQNEGISKIIQTIYYCMIMSVMGISAAFIDIPLLYILQVKLPEDLRGRVLSLGMSLVKTVQLKHNAIIFKKLRSTNTDEFKKQYEYVEEKGVSGIMLHIHYTRKCIIAS